MYRSVREIPSRVDLVNVFRKATDIPAHLDDIVAACSPRFARLTARFNVRGGTYPTIVAEHRKPGWVPQPAVDLAGFEGQSNVRG